MNAENGQTKSIGFLPWDEESRTGSLQVIFDCMVGKGWLAIEWYQPRIRSRRVWARAIRLGAIGCSATAGIFPMLAQLDSLKNKIEPVWASIFLALAAALVLLDRFFGLSSSWMRFVTTEMSLQEMVDVFRLDWETARASWKGRLPGDDEVSKMLTLAKDFLSQMHATIREETNIWNQQFSSALKDLDVVSRKGGETVTPAHGKVP